MNYWGSARLLTPISQTPNSEPQTLNPEPIDQVGPNGKGKSTLLKLIGWRKLPIPDSIDVLMVEQEVVGDDTPALQASSRGGSGFMGAPRGVRRGSEGREGSCLGGISGISGFSGFRVLGGPREVGGGSEGGKGEWPKLRPFWCQG